MSTAQARTARFRDSSSRLLLVVLIVATLVLVPTVARASEVGVDGIAEVGTDSWDRPYGIVAVAPNRGCASGNVAVQAGGDNGDCTYEASANDVGVAADGGSSNGFISLATLGNARGTCYWLDVFGFTTCVHQGAAVSGTGTAHGEYSMVSASGLGPAYANDVAVSGNYAEAALSASPDAASQFLELVMGGMPLAGARSSGTPWKVTYRQTVRYKTNGSEMRHDAAETERTAGSGSYEAHAHATLVKGHAYDGEQKFSSFTHSCASITRFSAEARTCASPWQNTSHGGQWFLISGHYYDDDSNGSHDGQCDGCIDWRWVVP